MDSPCILSPFGAVETESQLRVANGRVVFTLIAGRAKS
jgi:hypothetical protein